MHLLLHSNRTEALSELTTNLQALVLSVARHAVETRGGKAHANAAGFKLDCTGIPLSEQGACREEVERLFSALRQMTVFDLGQPASNVSLS